MHSTSTMKIHASLPEKPNINPCDTAFSPPPNDPHKAPPPTAYYLLRTFPARRSTPPPIVETQLSRFWLTTLVMWTSFADILPPSWFCPSHKVHVKLIEEFGFLRRYFFASWGILQVLDDAGMRGEVGSVVVAAVGSIGRALVKFQEECGIADEDLPGTMMTKSFLQRQDVQAEIERVVPAEERVQGAANHNYFVAAVNLLRHVVDCAGYDRAEKMRALGA